jgi:Zn finger protein HypA/HybF involved in hydrogenase expression
MNVLAKVIEELIAFNALFENNLPTSGDVICNNCNKTFYRNKSTSTLCPRCKKKNYNKIMRERRAIKKLKGLSNNN